eukprot:4823288-Amphidinium_carterae.2
MKRARMLNLPLRFKMMMMMMMIMIRALYSNLCPLVIYGSEVSRFAVTSLSKVRTVARGALGRGTQLRRAAELELTLKGGIKADPQVAFDLYTIRAWQRACGNMHAWPPPGRTLGPLIGVERVEAHSGTSRPSARALASHSYVMQQVVARRPAHEFEGIDLGWMVVP